MCVQNNKINTTIFFCCLILFFQFPVPNFFLELLFPRFVDFELDFVKSGLPPINNKFELNAN